MAKAHPDPRIGTFTVPMDRHFPRTTQIYLQHLPCVRGTFLTHPTMMTDSFIEWIADFAMRALGVYTVYYKIDVRKVELKYTKHKTGYVFVFEHATDAMIFASEWAGK